MTPHERMARFVPVAYGLLTAGALIGAVIGAIVLDRALATARAFRLHHPKES